MFPLSGPLIGVFNDHCSCHAPAVCSDTKLSGECTHHSGATVHCIQQSEEKVATEDFPPGVKCWDYSTGTDYCGLGGTCEKTPDRVSIHNRLHSMHRPGIVCCN